MNVLIFVMAMLMLLSLMTYARLESYRDFAALKSEFKKYMESTERDHINAAEVAWYEKTKGSAKASSEKASVNATSRIPFAFFINPAFREAHKGELPQITEITKRLIQIMYGNTPFYQAMEQKQPGFTDNLLKAIMLAADNIPEESSFKITQIQDIAHLNLGDPELNDAFLRMLKGTHYHAEQKPQAQAEAEEGEEESSEEIQQANEYHSPQGYYSLYDYITLDKKPKIRVFLAPYLVLVAIFGDPAIAQNVISKRHDLYLQVIANKMAPSEASAAFKREFDFKYGTGYDAVLDFSVTKSNPNKYL